MPNTCSARDCLLVTAGYNAENKRRLGNLAREIRLGHLIGPMAALGDFAATPLGMAGAGGSDARRLGVGPLQGAQRRIDSPVAALARPGFVVAWAVK
jgi:HAMP domain-containing protein